MCKRWIYMLNTLIFEKFKKIYDFHIEKLRINEYNIVEKFLGVIHYA